MVLLGIAAGSGGLEPGTTEQVISNFHQDVKQLMVELSLTWIQL
jgi:hypothetical protein